MAQPALDRRILLGAPIHGDERLQMRELDGLTF
jgi:hypothetical protein